MTKVGRRWKTIKEKSIKTRRNGEGFRPELEQGLHAKHMLKKDCDELFRV